MILCHYLGSISVGIIFRNYGKEKLPSSKYNIRTNFSNIINTRYSSNTGFFVLFGNAVVNGVNTLLAVGGFVIVFSVVFKILSLFNIISILASILYLPLSLFGVTKDLCYAFISGLFEITIGCNNISKVASSSMIIKVTFSSFLIGFSGLSILAQCCNFLAKTDINTNLYILSKFLHGLFASIFTFLLYPICNSASFVSNFSDVYDTFYIDINTNLYILSKFLHGLFASIFTFLLYPICNSASFVSNFSDVYDTFYINGLWSYYLNNTNIIVPLILLTYLIFKFVLPNQANNKINF